MLSCVSQWVKILYPISFFSLYVFVMLKMGEEFLIESKILQSGIRRYPNKDSDDEIIGTLTSTATRQNHDQNHSRRYIPSKIQSNPQPRIYSLRGMTLVTHLGSEIIFPTLGVLQRIYYILFQDEKLLEHPQSYNHKYILQDVKFLTPPIGNFLCKKGY